MGQAITKLGSLAGNVSIIILDGDDEWRGNLRDRLSAEFPAQEVLAFADEAEAKERISEGQPCVFLVALSWYLAEFDRGSFHGLLGDFVPNGGKFIVYGDDMTAERADSAIQSGAFTVVSNADVESAVHSFIIAEEIAKGKDGFPIADAILNRANVGINILSPQMDVLWMNARTEEIVEHSVASHRRCWMRYHRFTYRKSSCHGCTANGVFRDTLAALAGGESITNGRRSQEHLLPIARLKKNGWVRKLERVEVNAAPWMSHDGKRVLAVIEATRFITEDWEARTPAHHRLTQVIEMARNLGKQSAVAQLPDAVSVYYRPEGTKHFYLFATVPDDPGSVPKVLRLTESHQAYSQVVAEGGHLSFVDRFDDLPCSHFVRVGRSPGMDCEVLIDVIYTDEKSEQLFSDDLCPYWEYVADVFDKAWTTREDELTRNMDGTFQGGTKWTTASIRDEAGLDQAVEALAQCANDALHPLSMYVRVFDHISSTFVKRSGFGPYFQIAPDLRHLQFGRIGSSRVAESREGVWCNDAEVPAIRQHLDRQLTDEELRMLHRITSYVTLPLVSGDRVLGTLCVQFDDDSLFSDVKCRFIRTMVNTLGAVLGNRRWALERATILERSRKLDATMFNRSKHPEEEEAQVVTAVTRMVFELTAAEVVVYYRYDATVGKLDLVSRSVQGTVPRDTQLVSIFEDAVGLEGLSAVQGKVFRAADLRGPNWQGVRDAVLRFVAPGSERRFCEWVGSVIAAPVIADSVTKGVLVAYSSIPRWLNRDDEGVIDELATKMGLWLAARDLTRRLNWHERTKVALNTVTGWMARVSDEEVLYRAYLLAVTTDECLGFNRAVLFRRTGRESLEFVATEGVGQCSVDEARKRWGEAVRLTLATKMEACRSRWATRPGDLASAIQGHRIDLSSFPELLSDLQDRTIVVRRRGEPPLLDSRTIQRLRPEGGHDDPEYVLVPIWMRGELVSLLYADRPFLSPVEIDTPRLDLTQLIAGEFTLMLEALKLREETHKTSVALDLAQEISYTFRTRAAAMEGRILTLPDDLRLQYPDEVAGLLRTVHFFERAGTLASHLLRLDEVSMAEVEKTVLSKSIREAVDFIQDGRINADDLDLSLIVRVEQQLLFDAFLEILWNACEFTERERGEIRVTLRCEYGSARVDIVDNGPGIHPEFRPHLFERFKCYPATRMGLGLSYAKRVLEACHGSIEEIGAWEHGAHFVLRIPLVEEMRND